MPPRASTRASSSAAAANTPAAPPTPPAPPASGPYDVVLNVQDGAKTLTVWLNNDEAVHVSTKPDVQPAVKRERHDLVTSRPHTRHVELTTEGAKTVFTMSTTYGSAERKLDDDKAVEVDERASGSSPVTKKRKTHEPASPVLRRVVVPDPCPEEPGFPLYVRSMDEGIEYEVQARSSDTVEIVRNQVEFVTGLAAHDHRLSFRGRELDPGRALSDYNIQPYALLHFCGGLRGGKPVIYLFPPTSLSHAQVSLALSPEWTFSALYPVVDINKNAVVVEGIEQVKQRVEWTVAAEPDGSLVELSSGLELSYLFWEATSTGIVTSSSLSSSQAQQVDLEPSFHPSSPSLDRSNGVVLAFSPFLAHLDAALSSLSLHTSARNDFITFWLPHFTRIRDAGKEVLFRFLPQAEYARAAELDVEPKPDIVTRVFLLFKGVETGSSSSSSSSGRSAAEVDWAREVGVDEVKARDESLFRVLEWGGMECV